MKDFYVDHKGDFDLKCFVIYFQLGNTWMYVT